MSHYKPYPAYTDSGVEWVGSTPSSWSVMPLFSLVEERTQANKGMLENNLLSLSYGNIIKKDINSFEGLVPESYETYQIVEVGDIVFRLTDLQNDKRSLRSAKCCERGIITSAYLAVAPKRIQTGYFSYLMRSYDQVKVFYSMGGGMRQSMRYEDLRRMMVLLPSGIEQQHIAAYLDRETTRIDDLIAKKTRFIELLKEKRQALITQAVTKGLDSNVKMKDSGVEWLGEVPEHWKVKGIGYVIDAVGDVDHFMPESVERGIPYLMTGDLKERVSLVDLEKCKQVSYQDYLKLSRKIKCSKGDVILARYATIGTSMYVDIDIDFLVSYSCVTIKTTPSVVSGLYLFQYLKSDTFYQGIKNQVNTNTQDNVGIDDLKKVKMALPDLIEQLKILEFLEDQLKNIDNLAQKTELSITLLKERRSALITAAVTGQIDLREAA